jgi:aminopeptidase N
MHPLKSLLLIIVITLPGITAAQQADSTQQLPPTQWARPHNADIKHLVIDIRFNWQKKQAYGSATISLSLYNPANTVSLDAGLLTIESVVLANNTPLRFVYDGSDRNDALMITLDRMYQPGEDITVKINYHTNWVNRSDPNNLGGSFGKGIRFLGPTSTTPKKRRQIWSMGEPEFNRYWFPGYDAPNDLRTTELIATVDKELMVISNGTLIIINENSDGTRTYHWKTEKPYPNYLTSFVAGAYTDVQQNYEDIALHSFGYPDEKEAVTATTERLPDMVKFFSELTGMRYPYTRYSQVMVQDFPFPGVTGQNTATTISDNMIDDFRTHADFLYLWDGVEADALASQWFGNLLSPRDWADIWLSKSFTHYLDGLYADYKNGHDEFLSWYISFDQSATLADWNAGYRHPVVTRQYENVQTFTADNYATRRGALILRMLRNHVGDDNWWKAIRHYVKSNAGKQVTTEDFRRVIEETTGEPMDWFFDQWLYKMGHPVFEVSKSYDAEKKRLTLYVKQTQQPDTGRQYPQVAFFKGSMEVEIDGRIEKIWIKPAIENVFTFPAEQEPKLVHFDYESTWIKELRFSKSLQEWLYQLQNDKDILGKLLAMNELTSIAKNEKTSVADRTIIYTALRNVVLSSAYWRLRVGAIIRLQNLLAPAADTNPVALDEATIGMLLTVIKNDKPWVRTSAISLLGMTRDPKYADIYLEAFNDQSDRVINAAANALGKSKSPLAFPALAKLTNKPSWKSQSLISALNGLKELGDPRGVAIAMKALADKKLPRWWLAVPVWDYPIAAAETLVALGRGKDAFPMIFQRFKASLNEDDLNDIFSNVLLLVTLADARGQEAFDLLKVKFKNHPDAMSAVNQYETQFIEALKKK